MACSVTAWPSFLTTYEPITGMVIGSAVLRSRGERVSNNVDIKATQAGGRNGLGLDKLLVLGEVARLLPKLVHARVVQPLVQNRHVLLTQTTSQ